MKKTTQSSIIEEEILRLVHVGETNISNIYTRIHIKLGVPRPTIRRVRKLLVKRLYEELDVLDTSDNGGKTTK